jgi:hypothetical protein
MATTVFDPVLLIIVRVVHHPQDVENAFGIVHPADQSKSVIPDIENYAVANLIGRTEGLLECSKVGPAGTICQLMPDDQIPFGNSAILLPGLPELS